MDYTIERIKREWTKTDDFTAPLTRTRYTTWLSPDAKLEALVHEADGELAAVQDVRTGEILYEHPRTVLGRILLGRRARG